MANAVAELEAPEFASETGPNVSVCIANWNCRAMLRGCLQTLFERNQGVEFEVIVVDNASTDGAPEMVLEEFPQVQLIRNSRNVGFSKANNQAAAVARGRNLFFLNNDTELPANTLAQFAAYVERHPDVSMVGPRLLGESGTEQIAYRTRPTLGALLHRISLIRWTGLFRKAYKRYRRDTFEPNGDRTVEMLMGAAVFLPRPKFEAAGRWDESYRFGVEDLDLSAQAARHGRVVYTGGIRVRHFGRVSSRANIGFAAPSVAIGYVHYFRKSGTSPFRLFLYKSLVTLDLPLQLLGKVIQTCFRYAIGRKAKAAKSWLAVGGLWQFGRTALVDFWRA